MRSILRWVAGFVSLGGLALGFWWTWPGPATATQPLRWSPEAIVVLGGGDTARARETIRLSAQYPDAAVVVTGDGNAIRVALIEAGLPTHRLIHESNATSTYENAQFTRRLLDGLRAHRVVIVTNWFHAPRALAAFRKVQPDRLFAVSFEPAPDPLTKWDLGSARRERLASIAYAIRYGIW